MTNVCFMRSFIFSLCVFCVLLKNFLSAGAWNVDGNGNWAVDGNWNPATFPNGPGAVATLSDVAPNANNRSIALNQDIEVGVLAFQSTIRSYTITGPNTLTVAGIDASSTVNNTISANITSTTSISPSVVDGSLTFSGVVINGTIVKDGDNTLFLSGTSPNTNSGGITLNGGPLALAKSANVAAVIGPVLINDGTLRADADGQFGSGVQVSFGGGVNGILDINSRTASVNSISNDNGTVSLTTGLLQATTYQASNSSQTTIANSNGTLQVAGTLSLDNNSQISGGRTIAGALSNTNGATSTISGSFDLNGATVPMSVATGVTISGAITNTGNITKSGAGTLTFSGVNTYTGLTTVSAGTLAFSGSGTFPSTNPVTVNGGTFSISAITPGSFTMGDLSGSGGTVAVGAKTLNLGTASNSTYAGAITGTGSLTKQGSGNFTLSGAGNNITGTTTVSAGRLSVNGALTSGSGVSVGANGTLGGTGTVTGIGTINGTLSPGNSIGTITLIGNQTFTTGSTLEIELNPTTADRVNITGTLTIQPGARVLVIPDPGVYPTSGSYLIVDTTAGITGRFDSVVFTLPTFQGSLLYTADDILIILASLMPFADVIPCKRANALQVATCIDSLVPEAGSDLESVIAQLRFIPTVDELIDSLNEIQPSQLTALALSQESSTLYAREALFHRMDQLIKPCDRRGNLPEKRASVWITPYFGVNRQQGHHEEPGFRTLTGEALLGMDYAVTSIATLGASGGYSYNHLKWHEERGHAHMQNGYGSVYGNFTGKKVYLSTAFIGGYNHYSTVRKIEFPDDGVILVNRNARGKHNGYQVSGHAKGGLLFGGTGCFQFSPFLAADYLYFHEGSFTEKGAQSLNLHVHKKNSDLLQGEAGIQMFGCFSDKCSQFSPTLSLSAVQQARFKGKKMKANLKGTSCELSVNGRNPTRALFHVDAGFTVLMPNENNTLSLNYEGMFGRRYQDNSIFAEYIFRF